MVDFTQMPDVAKCLGHFHAVQDRQDRNRWMSLEQVAAYLECSTDKALAVMMAHERPARLDREDGLYKFHRGDVEPIKAAQLQ